VVFLGDRLYNGSPYAIGPLSCPVCPVLSVKLVYSGQTVGRIKMKLGTHVGLGPGRIVLYVHGNPASPPQKGHSPQIFGPYLLRTNGCMDQDATWYGGRPRPWRLCVRWAHSPSPKRGRAPAQFSAHFYCGQTAVCMKMPLGMEVGLSPVDFVFDGDLAPTSPKGGTAPQISAHVYCDQTAAWIKMSLGTKVGLCPDDIVLDGYPAPPPRKGSRAPSPIFGPCRLWPNCWMDKDGTWHGGGPCSRPHCARWEPSSPPQKGDRAPSNFRPIFIVAKRLNAIICHLVWRQAQTRRLCVRWGPGSPPQKGAEPPPQFSAHVYCGETDAWMKMPLGTEVGLYLQRAACSAFQTCIVNSH